VDIGSELVRLRGKNCKRRRFLIEVGLLPDTSHGERLVIAQDKSVRLPTVFHSLPVGEDEAVIAEERVLKHPLSLRGLDTGIDLHHAGRCPRRPKCPPGHDYLVCAGAEWIASEDHRRSCEGAALYVGLQSVGMNLAPKRFSM
jgi:hypothetical protein